MCVAYDFFASPFRCVSGVAYWSTKTVLRKRGGARFSKHFSLMEGRAQLRKSYPTIAYLHPACIAYYYLQALLIVYRAYLSIGHSQCFPKVGCWVGGGSSLRLNRRQDQPQKIYQVGATIDATATELRQKCKLGLIHPPSYGRQ